MIAIFKREIRNYLKRPLFWVGVLLVIYGVFNATSPYLTTHYLTTGEEIINDQSNTSVEGEVYEGYIPATPEKHREVWHEKVKIKLTDVFGLTDSEAQNVIEKLESMNLKEAYAYLEQEYDWYGARYLYEDSTYYKGTAEEINAYLDKKLEDKTFSFYYARKFADFAGLYMVFFAIIMLAVLFLQDTKKHTYELLHTKPVTAGKYVMGKVSAGFTICLLVLTILNILFWVLCRIYTKDSGFELAYLPVEGDERFEGSSSYTFLKSIRLAFSILLQQSARPLFISALFSVCSFLASFLFAGMILYNKISGEYDVNGYAGIMFTITLMGGMIFLTLAVMSLYLANIFEEVKGRPLYVIGKTVNFEEKSVS